MAHMTVEITTTRAISAQIIRHRSFSFQESSLRYSEAQSFVIVDGRRQDEKNRQNSIDDLSDEVQDWWHDAQSQVIFLARQVYQEALDKGIAKECARAVLPLLTTTKIYMTGSVRSWIHYLDIRTAKETQAEHREVAEAIREVFIGQFPVTAAAMGWAETKTGG
jgi:thymidylate synthase (FAD)